MWSVAQLLPKHYQTTVAEINLNRQGFVTFSPVFEKKKLYRHQWIVASEPLFRGYIFIELQASQRWVPINYTLGVSRLLTRQSSNSEYHEPCTIADDFVLGLQGCCHLAEAKTPWRLDPGTRVKIAHGPFAGREATLVSWSGADRARLITWLLNRDTVVEVHAADIVAVEAEASPEPPLVTGT